MEDTERLEELYVKYAGMAPVRCTLLAGAGSNRKYYEMSSGDGKTVIGTVGEDEDENRAFFAIAAHLRSKGIDVPQIMAVSDDGLCYIQQDLGRKSLYDAVSAGRSSGRYSDEEERAIEAAVGCLPEIAVRGAEGFDFDGTCLYPGFCRRTVFYDLNYFKYCFLKLDDVPFDENRLEDDFESLTGLLLEADCDYFMYRDFQSRNIMMSGGRPFFIDFQGARKGPLEYDLASFVWQAKAGYGEELRRRLVGTYLDKLSQMLHVERKEFVARLRTFVLFRMLQVLGAYGYRGLHEGKKHFRSSIPYALKNVSELFSGDFLGYPSDELRAVPGGDLEAAVPYLSGLIRSLYAKGSCLEVEICSFSYKKGLPQDRSGNGGGYIFDCRGILNPGRFEQYKSLDGRDEAVARFIEERTAMPAFLDNVFPIVDMHVSDFISRGFEHLFVAFGCTGGRHRSVYCAEKLASYLSARYPVRIKLVHREMEAAVK